MIEEEFNALIKQTEENELEEEMEKEAKGERVMSLHT